MIEIGVRKGGGAEMLLVVEDIAEAIGLVSPIVEEMLNKPKNVWGPHHVCVVVAVPGIRHRQVFFLGKTEEAWDEGWGPKRDFAQIAKQKLKAALREGCATSELADKYPWAFQKGEFLWPGGISVHGLGVGVSGAMGETDERIAWIVFRKIQELAINKKDILLRAKKAKI